ncbi:MAG: helix-turn-helix transcriptional regulator [Ureaplasma sp.]|nr:helix-turn-helix transcriptional regulator [Ureaplasma sp.]
MVNQNFKDARMNLNLSQGDLAKLVGVSRQTINMIENNDYNPTISLCRKICCILGKKLDDLFGEEN